MPRIEAEALASQHKAPADGATCPRCGAPDAIYSHTSPEGADFINDLKFDTYAARLREAGYEMVLYSDQCNRGQHERCTGRNGLTMDSAQDSSFSEVHDPKVLRPLEKNRLPHHCFCSCHKGHAAIPSLPRRPGQRFKTAWESFIKSCWKPIYDLARGAGLTKPSPGA